MEDKEKRLEEIKETMLKLVNNLPEDRDIESDHQDADSLLCEALEILGQGELTQSFHYINKWYA
mgnify:CR=1 FL=1